MKELVVDKKDNNKKIVSVLMHNFNGLHTSTVYKALRNKDIKVNDKRIHDNVTVFEGDTICIYIKDDLLFLSYSIIYEDINILIVNKPKGIEIISETSPNCLKSVLEDDLKCQLFPCHRLDLNTSGLVIFAKNLEALNILKEKFKNNEISILLSMDGDRETQTYNRPSADGRDSFDLTSKNIPALLEAFPNTTFRATIYAPTAHHTFENYLYGNYVILWF